MSALTRYYISTMIFKSSMKYMRNMDAVILSPSWRLWSLCSILLIFCLDCHGITAVAEYNSSIVMVKIGAVVDESTRIGKEQKVALKMAVQQFNDVSSNLKLSLLFRNSSSNPLQTASIAVKLAKEDEVKAIIGMQKWQEAALVAQVGNQYQLPILSLAPVPSTPPLAHKRWPYLVQMARTYSQQMKCISNLVKEYSWRRVIVVYEDDGFAGISLMLNLLSQTLQDVGSEIEYRLALPVLASMSDPKQMVIAELEKVLDTQSRVFILLQFSLPLAEHLFKEAKNMGLLGRDTAWIITESISSLLDSVNYTVISTMEGALGIKTHYYETSIEFHEFYSQFWSEFLAEYPKEHNPHPSIHSLTAFDAISVLTMAIKHLGNITWSSKELLERILSCSFEGLSGKISFQRGELSNDGLLRVINVVGKRYKDLDFWSMEDGFFERLGDESGRRVVIWPGDVKDVPRGWTIPSNMKPLMIGVPGRASFEQSVKVDKTDDPNRMEYSGFSIDVFREIVNILEESYYLPYEFVPLSGPYDGLINRVYNKTLDAVVGDVTILANRSRHVDFTQPYAKSGMSMIVPFKSKESRKAWLFTKPFTWKLWSAIGGVLLYTTITIWLLEHRSHPDFGGSRKKELRATLWFIFTSIFLSYKEPIKSNYSRIVVVLWLFVFFILTQSYTANLATMLTVPLLKPKIADMEWLINSNKRVGCDGDSFVRVYLSRVLGFKIENIQNISSQYYYPDFLNNGSIAAAFLELPFETVFLNEYCKTFTHTKQTYRFGGLGFVFPKGSPMVADVSRAILRLSELGVIQKLDDKWFSAPLECAPSNTNRQVEALNIHGFGVLYLFSGATSTLCFLLFLIRLLASYSRESGRSGAEVWEKSVKMWRYFYKGDMRTASQDPNAGGFDETEMGPPLYDQYPSSPTTGDANIAEHHLLELSPIRNSIVNSSEEAVHRCNTC